MNPHRAPTFLCAAIVVTALFAPAAVAADGPTAKENFHKTVQPLLQTYCFDCHGDGMKKGNVAFDQLKTDDALLDPQLWFNALKNVRAGLMPANDNKLKPEDLKTLETWIKRDVFKLDPKNPDPGRVTLRRLNRTEYRNTIKDLMGYDFKVEEEFPPDDTGYGFDTIGDVLSVSPLLLEKYMQAAAQIVPAAVGLEPRLVPEYVIPGARFIGGGAGGGGGGGGNANIVSFYKGGTFTQKYSVQRTGQYRIQVTISINGTFDFDPGKAKLLIKSDNDQISDAEYTWQNGKEYKFEYVSKFEPGDHAVTFVLTPSDASVPEVAQALPEAQDAQALAAQQADQQQQAALVAQGGPPRRTNVDLRIQNVKIQGPIDQKEHWYSPDNYTRFFTRAEPPKSDAERKQYAAEVLGRFGFLAFRRPVDSSTLDRLVTIAQTVYTQPNKQFEQGIQQAMIAMLSAPRFIFRIEETAAASKDEQFGMVDEYALASRLSYFLWSTMPDAQLFDLAKRGELRKNLDAQVKRMLADPRSEAFVTNFSGQWLQIRDIDNIPIDGKVVMARDAGTEAQLKAEEEAARAGRGARGNRGNRGQLNRGQFGQQPPLPNANPQAAPDAAQQPQIPPVPVQPQPQQGQADPQQPQAAAAVAVAPDAQAPANAAAVQAAPQADPQAAFAGRGAGRGRGNRQRAQQDPNAVAQVPAAGQNVDPQALAQVQPQQGQDLQAAAPNAQPAPAAQIAAPVVPPVVPTDGNAAGLGRGGAAPAVPPVADAQQPAQNQQAAAPAAARGARGNRGNFAGNRGNRGGRGGGGPPADELDPQLRRAMRQETEMYFGRIVHENRSVLELIDSNWTYLNERLAYHYRIEGVTGQEMRLVTLPENSPRGGVLTQGAILSVTSNPTRTSPVKRGLFILDNILGTPPPPPPNDIPPFEDAEKKIDGHEPTVRETLELHRNSALCKSCHARMDPLGLALENFNAMGMWREKERNQDVEVKGQLVTGEQLGSAKDLKKVIVKEHRADYYRTLTEKMLTYALGRGTDYYDVESVDQIVEKLETSNGEFSALLMGVIDAAPFQKRRNNVAPVAGAAPATRPVAQAN